MAVEESGEQVAVYFDVMGFPSGRERDVIGQYVELLTNHRLVRAPSSILCGCVENSFTRSVIKITTRLNKTPSY